MPGAQQNRGHQALQFYTYHWQTVNYTKTAHSLICPPENIQTTIFQSSTYPVFQPYIPHPYPYSKKSLMPAACEALLHPVDSSIKWSIAPTGCLSAFDRTLNTCIQTSQLSYLAFILMLLRQQRRISHIQDGAHFLELLSRIWCHGWFVFSI